MAHLGANKFGLDISEVKHLVISHLADMSLGSLKFRPIEIVEEIYDKDHRSHGRGSKPVGSKKKTRK